MNAQDFLTNVNISYTLLMIALLLFALLAFVTSKSTRKK